MAQTEHYNYITIEVYVNIVKSTRPYLNLKFAQRPSESSNNSLQPQL